jgi:SAM-dependent methyltransferase
MAEIKVSDNWAHGDAYERYVGRWSRRVAPMFLSWLDARSGAKWADIGCGTGALCAAILDHCRPSSVTGVEPSEGFLETARGYLAGRVTLQQGSATAIPLAEASVDFVVSALVLNFVPDQRAAVTEMARVVSPGGTVAAYVWDYSGKMELMQHFWAAAESLDASVTAIAEKHRFPGCRPEPLRALFSQGGLDGIDVTALDVAMPFASFDDYWKPFLGGQGPAPAYAMSLDETARSRLSDALRDRLPIQPDGSIPLAARAWAVRGVRGAATEAF